MENKWWLRWSKMEQHLIERRCHQEPTTSGTEEKLWRNKSQPQTDYRRVFSILSVPQENPDLCVNLCGALQSLWYAGNLQHSSWHHHSSASLVALPPFSSSFPTKLQPYITKSSWMDFFVHFISTTWHLRHSGSACGSVIWNIVMKNHNSHTEHLQRHQVHEISGFFHWFLKKQLKALCVYRGEIFPG